MDGALDPGSKPAIGCPSTRRPRNRWLIESALGHDVAPGLQRTQWVTDPIALADARLTTIQRINDQIVNK